MVITNTIDQHTGYFKSHEIKRSLRDKGQTVKFQYLSNDRYENWHFNDF